MTYALYLWHWPILAFYRYYFVVDELSYIEGIFCILLTAIFSFLSRKIIEVPLNNVRWSFQKVSFWILFIPTATLAIISSIVVEKSGLPQRITKADTLIQETLFLSEKYCHNSLRTDCNLNSSEISANAILFGDSHAGHYSPALAMSIQNLEQNIYAKSADSCPPVLHPSTETMKYITEKSNDKCLPMLKEVRSKASGYDSIILAGEWSRYIGAIKSFPENLRETLQLLKNKRVIILAQIPSIDNRSYLLYIRRKYTPLSQMINTSNSSGQLPFQNLQDPSIKANITISSISKSFANTIFITPQSVAPHFWAKAPFFNGLLIYRDGMHLNEYGAKAFGSSSEAELFYSKIIN